MVALTDTLRRPLGVELPGSLYAERRFSGDLTQPRAGAFSLPVSIREDEPFEPHIPRAAGAARFVEKDAEGTTWWMHMPAAGRKNTEVVWDPRQRKLSVGAWSRDMPGESTSGRAGTRGAVRLLGYSSTWQPDADGARATASIAGGWVAVRLPHAIGRAKTARTD